MDTPDNWDETPMERVTDSFAEQTIDTAPKPAVMPGHNVFAREFVPNFGPRTIEMKPQVPDVDSTNSAPFEATPAMVSPPKPASPAKVSGIGEEGSQNGIEKMDDDDGGTWSDKASECGSVIEEGDNEGMACCAALVSKPKKAVQMEFDNEMRKDHLNIVFIGHVDAGKSTIGGHIMYLTGMVDKRTLEKYEKEAKEKNRESWYLSWALDTNLEERDKGKTVEVGRAFFETENKHFTILDAPGHRSFVPNMIGGASQADVAVLVISARKGEFETGFERGGQTREHALLVKTAGVRHMVIVVNKMDDPTVEWDVARFNEIKDKLTPYLKKCGFNPKTDIHYIPVSGLTGVNLKDTNRELCPWYEGQSLINYLDQMPPISRMMSDGPVRLPIVSGFKDMGTIVLGKLESGTVSKGQVLTMMPNKCSVEVMMIWSDEDETEKVLPGENVKIKLKNVEEEDISPGFILCSPDNLCHVAKVFDAQVVILEHKSIICAGFSANMHLHTCSEVVVIKALICLVDKKTNEKTPKPRFIKQDNVAIVRLEVSGGMICLETFQDFPQMGRFTLRDDNHTIAIGKVMKILK